MGYVKKYYNNHYSLNNGGVVMIRKSFFLVLVIVLCFVASVNASQIYVSDTSGHVGVVDTSSGVVSNVKYIGPAFTDIAFNPQGKLYGVDAYSTYEIDLATNNYTYLNGGIFKNALVFDPQGTAYTMSPLSVALYTLNLTPYISTPETAYMNIYDYYKTPDRYYSEGDLDFGAGGYLYLTGDGGDAKSTLIKIDTANKTWSKIATLTYDNVYGLAYTDGKMFGLSGTDVFEISLSDGTISNVHSFANQGLSSAYGAAVYPAITQTPEPVTMLLLGLGLMGLVGMRKRLEGKK
jgi:hypothetical protein